MALATSPIMDQLASVTLKNMAKIKLLTIAGLLLFGK
jgi:hypothetical protein